MAKNKDSIKTNIHAKKHSRELFSIALILTMLYLDWSVQADYQPNKYSNNVLSTDLADKGNGLEDVGIAPLVTSCDTPFVGSSVMVKQAPRSIAFGDFNNDGNTDFAAVNTSVGNVSIRLGDGTGNFIVPATPEVSVGISPRGIRLGDFNKDGNLDFAVTGFANGASAVSIGLGNGNGAFSVGNVPVGTQPVDVAVGDFDNDGNLDFATANAFSNSVSIRLGNGGGVFPTGTDVAVGSSPQSIVVADFNKDGKLDFATANQNSNNVSIRLGNGDGTFSGTTSISVNNLPVSVAVGDFNKDGKLDLITANNFTPLPSASIRLGDGNGGFTGSTSIALSGTLTSVAVGDLNKDGNLDFVVASATNNVTFIRLGNGSGTTFTTAADVTVDSSPQAIAIADINNDGNPDFGTANQNSNNVSIKLGNGNGVFKSFAMVDVAVGVNPQSLVLEDFNKDGNLDFAVANQNSNSVSIRLGNGSDGFTSPETPEVTVGSAPRGVTVGDLNNDGKLDFIAGNSGSNNVSIRLGDGNGGFSSPATPEVAVGNLPISVMLADFNKDGNLDFAAVNQNSGNVSIRLGNGNGGFTTAADVAVGTTPNVVAIGDFNRDGNPDLAVCNIGNANVSIRLGNGNGGFISPETPEIPVGGRPISVQLGDINNDGKLDFATANSNTNNVAIRLGDGNGGFGAPTPAVMVGSNPQFLTLADFNKDGFLDFATANQTTNNVSIRLGEGGGFFRPVNLVEIDVSSAPVAIANGDFNKDGDLDFITANSTANSVSVVFGICQSGQRSLQYIAGSLQNAIVNTTFGVNLKARATNAGSRVSGTIVTFTAPATGASGTFAGGTNVVTVTTDAGGFATAPAFTANAIAGTYQVIAKITIAGTDRFSSFTLTNTPACSTITLSPSTLNNGTPGTAYSQIFTANGGVPIYKFAVSSGSLPPGLTLTNAGLLSGTPTAAGTFNFTVTTTDRNGCTGTQAYTVNIGTQVTGQTTISVISTSYNANVTANYVGTYTINTLVKNNGANLTGNLYFQITNLSKVGADLDPTRPDRLLSADNGAGINGDIQTVSTTGIASGDSLPVSFNVGIGSRQSFNFFVNLYNSTGNRGAQSPIGSYQFTVSEGKITSTLTKSDDDNQFDLVNAVTADNTALISGAGAQSRPITAIDANNNDKIAVVANDLNTRKVVLKTTQDGGASWTTATLPQTVNAANYFTAQNASLAYDSTGKLYIAYTLGNLNDAANALVVTSTLDGSNFDPLKVLTQHTAVEKVIDSRPVIAISNTNAIYVAWDKYTTSTHNFSIQIATALSGGVFRIPVNIITGLVSSPALAISKSGIVYLGWNNWGFNSAAPFYNNGGRIMVTSSRNNGATFTPANQIGLTNIGFARNINAMPDAGVVPNLTLAVDSKLESTIYAVYTMLGQGMDVVFASSTNSGQMWKTTKVVSNDANNADQFNPAITINKADGTIKLAFYNTSLSTDNGRVDLFVAQSNNSGTTFTNHRVTTTSSNDSKANLTRDFSANLGERIGIAVQNDSIVLVWTDTRHGSEDIFIEIDTRQ